jgi:hypothetical protein
VKPLDKNKILAEARALREDADRIAREKEAAVQAGTYQPWKAVPTGPIPPRLESILDHESETFAEAAANLFIDWVKRGADTVFIKSVFQRIDEKVQAKLETLK